MIRMKLIVAHAKCAKCGFERMLYFTSPYIYGERVVSTRSGKHCAHVNLFNENIIQELDKYCAEYFSENGIELSKGKLARIISSIYGITCDEIFGERIDTTPNPRCVNCGERTMVENKEYGERQTEVELLEVTHSLWMNADEKEKRDMVKRELARQGYLDI